MKNFSQNYENYRYSGCNSLNSLYESFCTQPTCCAISLYTSSRPAIAQPLPVLRARLKAHSMRLRCTVLGQAGV